MEGVGMTGYAGRRVFITGHSGFKGAWLTQILLEYGAEVCGYSLEPPTRPSLFELLSLSKHCNNVTGDIRDMTLLAHTMNEFRPDIIIHMAAQPLVIDSYVNPVYTYETNAMGTVYLLEAARHCGSVRSIVNVTTDKVYQNNEWAYGYREIDTLNGYDPYSNSKSCSELITDSYRRSFFDRADIAVSTVRAGNVIGGGDFSENRIIPDCYRAVTSGEPIVLRNPHSVRPYQHVLEPLFMYLFIAMRQSESRDAAGCYNIGPCDSDCVKTVDVAALYQKYDARLKIQAADAGDAEFHEAGILRLDCSKARMRFGYEPVWRIETAIEKTVAIYNAISCEDMIYDGISKQLHEYDTAFKERIRG